MAKKADATKPKKKAKAAKDGAKVSVKVKASKGKKTKHSGVDALSKLAEHPIVGDLIAVGATAAVAAIAAGLAGQKRKDPGKAVKAARKAAAAAIGARLVEEYKAVRDSAEAAKAKG